MRSIAFISDGRIFLIAGTLVRQRASGRFSSSRTSSRRRKTDETWASVSFAGGGRKTSTESMSSTYLKV